MNNTIRIKIKWTVTRRTRCVLVLEYWIGVLQIGTLQGVGVMYLSKKGFSQYPRVIGHVIFPQIF